MISGSTTELSFIQIGGGATGPGMRSLLIDVVADPAPQCQRRNGQSLSSARFRVAGDVIEDLRDVPREHGIGGEERKIGVNPRGDRMIVAGADMDI